MMSFQDTRRVSTTKSFHDILTPPCHYNDQIRLFPAFRRAAAQFLPSTSPLYTSSSNGGTGTGPKNPTRFDRGCSSIFAPTALAILYAFNALASVDLTKDKTFRILARATLSVCSMRASACACLSLVHSNRSVCRCNSSHHAVNTDSLCPKVAIWLGHLLTVSMTLFSCISQESKDFFCSSKDCISDVDSQKFTGFAWKA